MDPAKTVTLIIFISDFHLLVGSTKVQLFICMLNKCQWLKSHHGLEDKLSLCPITG